MNDISSRDLLNRYDKNKDLNFLAFVVTPWAAHGVEAFLKYMLSIGMSPKGLVIILEHGQAGYIVDEKHFSMGLDGVSYYRLNDSTTPDSLKLKICSRLCMYKENLWKIQQKGKKLFVLNQGIVNYIWHAKLKHLQDGRFVQSVVIDEGIGMYMRDENAWLKEDLSNTKRLKDKLSIILSRMVINPKMGRHLKNNKECIDFCLLRKMDNGYYSPDPETVDYYREAICHSGAYVKNHDSEMYENAVVINTQPFYEYNQVYRDEDLLVLNNICEVCERRGIKVVLKPHPREKNIFRYESLKNCMIDKRQGITQESIISSLRIKPKMIVGFSSTTLVSEKVFDQIPSVSLIACINLSNIEEKMRTDFMRFKETFCDIVEFPQNMESFEELINQL